MRSCSNLKLILTSFIVAACAASAAPGATVRYFGATITPTQIGAGAIGPFSLQVLNCDGTGICLGSTTSTNQNIGSATVGVPAGFTVAAATLSVSASSGKHWSVSLDGSTIVLGADGGTNKLQPGESLTVSFNATAPCSAGSYPWTVSAYQDTLNSDGTVNEATPFTQVTPPLSVAVVGACTPEEFASGDYCSITQGGWGAPPSGDNPGWILASHWPSSGFVIGGGFTMTFTSASAVEAYLPAGGMPAGLITSYLNPTSTGSGVFGGQVLALRINLDLQPAIQGAQGPISSLKLTNTGTSLDGKTIAEILAEAEIALGGGAVPPGYAISDLNSLITNLNEAFDACVPTQWAKDHLTP